MKENEIIEKNDSSIMTSSSKNFITYLEELGLPTNNIVASDSERLKVLNNFPEIVSSISPGKKKNSAYLSKFIASCAIGLFDAGLNYLWNEVIITLRKNIEVYGLDLFFDAAVGSRARDNYSKADDLILIKDRTLLDTCKKLEIIENVTYLKLAHILDMRNNVGASHCNEYNVNSYELLGWLQNCIDEVLLKEPSDSALVMKSIISNIKNPDLEIEKSNMGIIEGKIKEFSIQMASNLMLSLFGIFTANTTNEIVRKNVLTIAPIVWKYSNDDVKYSIGEKADVYRAALDNDKLGYSETFLKECGGLNYLTLDARIIKLSELSDSLVDAAHGWDNYINEVLPAREIMDVIKNSSDIPPERFDKVANSIIEARIGKEVNYCSGVSPQARKYYDSFFKLLNQEQTKRILELLEFHSKFIFSNSIMQRNFMEIIKILSEKANSERISEILNYILEYGKEKKIRNLYVEKGFLEITRNILFVK